MANEIFQVKTESLQYVLDSSTNSHRFYGEPPDLLLVAISYRLKQECLFKMRTTQSNNKLIEY